MLEPLQLHQYLQRKNVLEGGIFHVDKISLELGVTPAQTVDVLDILKVLEIVEIEPDGSIKLTLSGLLSEHK